MFGRKKKDRERGQADVMSIVLTPGGGDQHHATFEVVLDVRPESGAPFRTTIRQEMRDIVHPKAGDNVRVTIGDEPSDVRIDLDDDPRFAAQDKQVGLSSIARHQLCDTETQRLEKSGVPATAVVAACSVVETLQVTRGSELSVRATVNPPEGAPFDATFSIFTFSEAVRPPATGETINVLFDPADHTMVRATMMWRQSAASQIAAVHWNVPAECPECGARVDQSAASTAAHPTCPFCHQPLPVTPAG